MPVSPPNLSTSLIPFFFFDLFWAIVLEPSSIGRFPPACPLVTPFHPYVTSQIFPPGLVPSPFIVFSPLRLLHKDVFRVPVLLSFQREQWTFFPGKKLGQTGTPRVKTAPPPRTEHLLSTMWVLPLGRGKRLRTVSNRSHPPLGTPPQQPRKPRHPLVG